MKRTLVIFSKSPTPGRVKTRLLLPPETAASLHAAFIRDAVERHRSKDFETLLYRADTPEHPFWSTLEVPQKDQLGTSLGARMGACFNDLLDDRDAVIIIGTDSPNLPVDRIDKAFDALVDNDVVLGPACDGGYYLIGMSRFCPELFPGNMPWGYSDVFIRTLSILNASPLRFKLLDFWYDVDRPSDLALLCAHEDALKQTNNRPANHTLACIEKLGIRT